MKGQSMAGDEASFGDAKPEQRTVVIGGGQAGLATGYHLMKQGLPFVILDAHLRVGDAWRNRWDSLQVFTPARYSSLPGLPFPSEPFHYPTKDELADYFEDYAATFELPIRLGVRAEGLTRTGNGFEIATSQGPLLAGNVVVATGPYHRPWIPDFATDLDDSILQLHSKEYRNPGQLQEGPVLVVGAANSGAEIAREVARDHETWLSGRHPGNEPTRAGSRPDRLFAPIMWFAATRVIKVDNPIGRKVRDQFLDPPRGIPLGSVKPKDLDAAGIERVPRTKEVRDGYPVVDDGRVLDVSNVIWCTGFAPDFDWIDIPLEMRNGLPVQDRGVVESCPGLYFMGLLFQYSLSSALIGGVGRDAGYIVHHIVSTTDSRVDDLAGSAG
ncbi:MAG: flavin-containing monooxygenase [Actinomycetota bacterium]